ncbi:hypothetical protein AcW1_009636 [Taiwanofungus camphoratus]|nr:hypothetical protein AcW1_009636 [Antrodia cinnamomea]
MPLCGSYEAQDSLSSRMLLCKQSQRNGRIQTSLPDATTEIGSDLIVLLDNTARTTAGANVQDKGAV